MGRSIYRGICFVVLTIAITACSAKPLELTVDTSELEGTIQTTEIRLKGKAQNIKYGHFFYQIEDGHSFLSEGKITPDESGQFNVTVPFKNPSNTHGSINFYQDEDGDGRFDIERDTTTKLFSVEVNFDPSIEIANAGIGSSAEEATVQNIASGESGEENYIVPFQSEKLKRFSVAVKTSKGIVWTFAPKEDTEASNSSIYYPAEPFCLYISDNKDKNLSVETSHKLLELPLKEKEDYVFLDEVIGIGDYVIYHTYTLGKGAAQASKNQAWAFKIAKPQDVKEILAFRSAGGYHYQYGVVQEEGLYVSLSTIPGNADGSYDYEAYIYSPSKDKNIKIQNFDLRNGAIEFQYEGKSMSAELKDS